MATGVSEIIARADVAKATFYSYFRSKQELCLEYLEENHQREIDELRNAVEAQTDPLSRFMAPAHVFDEKLSSADYRGCRFLNISAEMPGSTDISTITAEHYADFRQLLLDLSNALGRAEPAAYPNLDVEQIASNYMLLICGTMAVVKVAAVQPWPKMQIANGVAQLLQARAVVG